MKGKIGGFLLIVYYLGAPATFVYLTFLDGYHYTWWNWLIAVPVNIFLSGFWPAYWLIGRPLFGS